MNFAKFLRTHFLQNTSRRLLLEGVLRHQINVFKGALSDLRQFLATENPLKVIANAVYFTLEVFFVLKLFNFCYDFLSGRKSA